MTQSERSLNRGKCKKSPIKCSRPGPITNNGYLNFLRDFRKTHCGLKPRELIIRAARSWNRLCESKKDHYRRMAAKVSAQRRKGPVCRDCERDIKILSSAFVNVTEKKGTKPL
ncbi:protamine-like [Drosophila serrata]|uniref:protamine-like n=1 Tax=Drosophila serrata TaxID=7274 RepID=UPI000A1CF5E3|nr:protamine-like [Drosophila serrata]